MRLIEGCYNGRNSLHFSGYATARNTPIEFSVVADLEGTPY